MADGALTERAVAAARAASPGAPARAADARWELWHGRTSICSQKVRVTLAETGQPWSGHALEIMPPRMENAHPAHVRLRMTGADGRAWAGRWSGRSSARSEGLDPAAVPTLVDHRTGEVLLDSRAICLHVDAQAGGRLVPERQRREVEAEVDVVDRLPIQALVFGAHPDGDLRPEALRKAAAGLHDRRIMKLMEGRSLVVGDAAVTAAYDAKIRKEAAARAYLRTPDMVRGAAREIVEAVAALDGRLADGRDWAAGAEFTLADVFWAVALWRLQAIGMALAWQGGHALNADARRHVAAYAERLFARPSVRAEVVEAGGPAGSGAAEAPSAPHAERRALKPGEHGRDLREDTLTAAVLETFRNAPNPRSRQILSALARHLHAFLEEVAPTEREWERAIDFLTRTGRLSQDGRQEFILLSDVMGATARVDMINHRFPDGATENSVLGPFYVEEREAFPNGADISAGIKGEPMVFNARVLDTDGRPVAGARVDVWHADEDGGYDILNPNLDGLAMRGMFRSDPEGRFWFTSILPAFYPIPMDGTVGDLLRAAGRSPVRPAHVHVRVEAPGFERLTTMLFVDGDAHLDSDPVFGVKSSLVMDFEKRTGVRMPDGQAAPSPCWAVDYDFVLARRR